MNNSTFEKMYNPDEMVEVLEMSKEPAQYSWEDTSSNELVFMNPKTFEEVRFSKSEFDKAEFLFEGMEVQVNKNGDNVVGIQLPLTAEYTVVSLNQENMRYLLYLLNILNSCFFSGNHYVATLNSGARIQVPLNVKVGLRIKVSTEDGSFVGRAA